MATGTILLPVGGAVLPDGSASNAAPALQRVKSSATAPAIHFLQFAFDAGTDEMVYWTFRMPVDYASAPVLKVKFKMASATTGNIIISGRIGAVTAGDSTDVDAKALGTDNVSSATAVAGTAGFETEVSLALANADSLAASDSVFLRLARAAANASDTATGDMEVYALSLEYTTT